MTATVLWALIAFQIVMGLFDTLYHHEATERLAWRQSQRNELRLHGLRNFLYAAVFLTLGWFEVHGWLAMLMMAVLAAELIITLVDFVEEDLSRKLAPSERITHTLLTINYGAILVLLMPVLLGWAERRTALQPAFYGAWSILAGMAAAGTVLFGLRDLQAAARLGRLRTTRAAELVGALADRQHVLVTGATGFIGRRLVEALISAGHDVTVLVRDVAKAELLTPPFRLVTSLNHIPSDAVIDTVVNLAGEPIADGLWTAAQRRRMLRSRLRMTRDIVRLIGRLTRRPTLLISGSAVGWYGLRGDEVLAESAGARPCFSHTLCDAWERAAVTASNDRTRVVCLRIGLVLGMLSRLLTPFEFGLGGPIGRGTQWMSWIARDDLIRLIAHVMATPSLTGVVNATAPTPVPNAVFARELGSALRRPAFMRLPAALLRFAGDVADELLLGGQRVVPARATSSGFVFLYDRLDAALAAMLGADTASRRPPLRLAAGTVPPGEEDVVVRPLK